MVGQDKMPSTSDGDETSLIAAAGAEQPGETLETPEEEGFRELEPGVYEVVSYPEPRGGLGRLLWRLRRTLIGHPIESEHEAEERLSKASGLALLGADNIASSIYGPEEIMRALMLAGAGALLLATPLAVAIVVLLAVVAISYQQTIRAYPRGGGSYIVASDNLGPLFGVVAGCALLIDYVLDVAVSVAAGVQSLTSVYPALHTYRVALCLGAVAVMMLANLRGVRASGALSAVPVYVYLVGALGVVAYGSYKWANGVTPAYVPPEGAALTAIEPLGLVLILRAFSSGAVALSGVEAISDGVAAFKPPESENARKTLMAMASIFAVLFLGISVLASWIGIVPDSHEVETVVSQLTRTLIGRGPYYYVVQFSTIVLLVLAANTAFADFPRLASFMARDKFLPSHFSFRGERLAYSNGIIALGAVAGLLIVIFGGSVTALIPLFTVGVFIAFTLSESGMVLRWWRSRAPGWRRGLAVNASGAVATAIVAVIVGASKFVLGAWVVLILIPLFVVTLLGIRRHYHEMAAQLSLSAKPPGGRSEALARGLRHDVVIPVGDLDRAALRAVAHARAIFAQGTARALSDGTSHDPSDWHGTRVSAVYITDDLDEGEALRERWEAAGLGVPMVLLESPYRALIGPLMTYIAALEHEARGHQSLVTVLVPEAIPAQWWEHFLHTQTALMIKGALLFREGVAVMSVPLHLRD